MKFNLRDLFWAILVISLAIGWWMERSQLRAANARVTAEFPLDVIEAIEAARAHTPTKHPVQFIRKNKVGDEIELTIGWGGPDIGGGDHFRLKKIDGKWKVIEHDYYVV
jgi:hypothetical protein